MTQQSREYAYILDGRSEYLADVLMSLKGDILSIFIVADDVKNANELISYFTRVQSIPINQLHNANSLVPTDKSKYERLNKV